MTESEIPLDATPEQWADWRWHMRNRIRSAEALRAWIEPTEEEEEGIEGTKGVFQWSITPYYASLMDPVDALCAVRRQVVPLASELAPDFVGVEDPLEEVAHSPVKNLIHNYRDRVAFCVTSQCAIYCRYCLRKRMVGEADFMMRKDELREAIAYIAAHPEIKDVLLTGGDPLTLGDANIDWLLTELRAIDHVDIIRIGSRMPVKLPQRITPELCAVLEKHHPVWVNTHFNHPKELTPEAGAAIDRLLKAGVPVGNQTVLLRGINDNVATMRALCEGLVRHRIRPYYLYQAQLIGGTAHLRTSIETGLHIMHELQGHLTGFAIPKYVLDTPLGKIPLTRDYILGRDGDRVVMKSTRGAVWAEPNPRPARIHYPSDAPSDSETVQLREVKSPPGTQTLSMETGQIAVL
ncbi:MAG: KamA family radical SAM protein [Bacteroidetes bacterium]|nr:KamA family radical SAM protein [Bacteroidota bacterium]